MRKIFSLIFTLLPVTILYSVYHVTINDSAYAQLYFQPTEEQPLDTFNNQPLDTFNNQPLDTFNNQPLDTFNNQPLDTFNNQPTQIQPSPQQTPIRKVLWTS